MGGMDIFTLISSLDLGFKRPEQYKKKKFFWGRQKVIR